MCINNKKLFENLSEPSFSGTILDHQEPTSIQINQSLTSVKNIYDIFPTFSDEYLHPNFTNIMSHSFELEQLTETNNIGD